MEVSRLADATLGLRHVFLRNLVLPAEIGVHPHEHGRRQRIRLNIDLAVADDASRGVTRAPVGGTMGGTMGGPIGGAVGADELSRVVDYEALARGIRALVAAQHVRLVETLAERIAEFCLEDPRVFTARIRVEKLEVFADAESAGVEVERRRR